MARELSKKKKEAIKSYFEDLPDEKTLEVLKTMKEIMNKSFGEEKNQIIQPVEENINDYYTEMGYTRTFIHDITDDQFIRGLKDSGIGYTIIIKFPEVTISNSKKMSHVIKDLYVKFSVKKDGKFGGDIKGVRTIISEEEFHTRYMHSHLPAFSPESIRFDNFCTGEGPINQVISLLRSKFDETNFTLFCLHLKNYVAWESLEGNPYMHMEYIGTNMGRTSGNTITIEAETNTIATLKAAILDPKISDAVKLLHISINTDRIAIESTEEFEIWAANFMQKVDFMSIDRSSNMNSILCYKDGSGNYVPSSINRTRQRIAHQTTPIFKFKGEDKFLTVIKQDNEIQATKYLSPSITQELCGDLSRGFTKIAIEAKGFEEQEDTPECLREVAEPDLFPL